MKTILITCLVGIPVLFLCAELNAEEKDASYSLPITRNGKTSTRLAYDFWSGEYPQPVIDFHSMKAGESRVMAYRSLRKLDKPVQCTIRHGLYHPWSKNRGSVVTFYTLKALEGYESLADQKLGEYKLKKGDQITEVIPLAEGLCAAKKGKTRLDIECSLLERANAFKPLMTSRDSWQEQWLYLDCKEGYKAFIQDHSFLKTPGASQGEIVGYGEVGPHLDVVFLPSMARPVSAGDNGVAFIEVVQPAREIRAWINGIALDMSRTDKQVVPVRTRALDQIKVALIRDGKVLFKSTSLARMRAGVIYVLRENPCSIFELYSQKVQKKKWPSGQYRYGVRGGNGAICVDQRIIQSGDWSGWIDVTTSANCLHAAETLEVADHTCNELLAKSSFIFLHDERLDVVYDFEKKDLVMSLALGKE